MSPRQILDSNDKPFNDFSRAAWLRDILIENTGRPWTIESVGSGFVVEAPEDSRSDPTGSAIPPGAFETLVFRPALRVLLPWYIPFLALGMLAVSFADDLAITLLRSLNVSRLPPGVDAAFVADAVETAGTVILGLSMLAIVIPWLSNSYVVGPDGIEQRQGILSRDSTSIRLSDIRSINLKQGIIARLLNVGTLEFASAGTGGIDVRFTDVAGPLKIKRWIESLLRSNGDSERLNASDR